MFFLHGKRHSERGRITSEDCCFCQAGELICFVVTNNLRRSRFSGKRNTKKKIALKNDHELFTAKVSAPVHDCHVGALKEFPTDLQRQGKGQLRPLLVPHNQQRSSMWPGFGVALSNALSIGCWCSLGKKPSAPPPLPAPFLFFLYFVLCRVSFDLFSSCCVFPFASRASGHLRCFHFNPSFVLR